MTTDVPHFASFLMGGFEGASPLLDNGTRLDLLGSTRHDRKARDDYRLLLALGIKTVRESFSWSRIDTRSGYDFSRYLPLLQAAQDLGVQQIWSLNHFDFPDWVDPYGDNFPEAFAKYAAEAVKVIRRYQKGTLYINPINEISFVSYMSGFAGAWAPFAIGRPMADELKKRLVQASIVAMDAIWRVESDVRFVQIDPLFRRVIKPPVTPGKKMIWEDYQSVRLATLDMFAGRLHPEIGGGRKYLDIIGCNYYITNQEWIIEETFEEDSEHREFIPLDSPDRVPLSELLSELENHYHRPIILSETGSYGSLRRLWWKHLLKEAQEAIHQGLPLFGICAYPVIDRHDWHDGHLTNSGLWDFHDGDKTLARFPHRPTIKLIKEYAQTRMMDLLP